MTNFDIYTYSSPEDYYEAIQQRQQLLDKCTNITEAEFNTLYVVSKEESFILAMDKLKGDDIIDFNLKLTQFKANMEQVKPHTTYVSSSFTSSVPKCPTCGSTDITKISGTKRWLGVGLFGLASSDVGKTMQCNSCGTKW